MERRLAACILAVFAYGCSTAKPVVYPNERYQQVGQSGFEGDLAACKAMAERGGAAPGAGRTGEVAKSAGVGTVAGAAAGAAGGAVWGNAGRGAASGAVGGLVGGLLWPLLGRSRQPNPAYVNFVDQCLTDRGYQVTGWR